MDIKSPSKGQRKVVLFVLTMFVATLVYITSSTHDDQTFSAFLEFLKYLFWGVALGLTAEHYSKQTPDQAPGQAPSQG